MRLIISIITAMAVLFGGLFGGAAGEASAGARTEAGKPSAVTAFHETLEQTQRETDGGTAEEKQASLDGHADVDYADMAYEHYDPKWFYYDTDKLCGLADASDIEGVIELYDSLYEEFLHIDTMYTLAMIRYDAALSDTYWTDEYLYSDNLWTEMADALSTAGAYVLESPVGDAFSEHIGEEKTLDFSGYIPLTDEQIEATDRISGLQEQYNALKDDMGGISYEYLGENWTVDMFYGYRGDNLWRRDYEGYLKVYNGLNKAICEAFSPIFIELTELWNADARESGYDDYADYAYECVYGRSYSPDQAQDFCDTVKPIAREYYTNLYYSELYDEAFEVGTDMDTEALFEAVGAHLAEVDASLLAPWRYMLEHGLYNIETAGTGRYDGSYTTFLSRWNAPFLFQSSVGSCADLITLTHEFGHFSDYYFTPPQDVLADLSDLDLCEIHSNGLQALFSAFYGDIFPEGKEAAVFMDLDDLLMNVIDGCMLDEFQRRVFSETEELTAERINELYLEICLEYGVYDRDDLPEYDAGWVYIGHLFLSPAYYFSYAASGFAALQIWDMAQEDFDAAAQAYLGVLRAGAYEDGHFTVLRRCGLKPFTDKTAAVEVLERVIETMERMDRAGGIRGHNR